jgi:GT2 family glycosyltransferase
VVCSHNGERTIRDCLEGLLDLEYPDYEVIVVDDGSTDATAKIASEYELRLISTENRGLSNARNTGMEAATGEIVAYLDDDTRPDRAWLTYLAASFLNSEHAGIGGPNIAPPGDGLVAECVANAPGNPVHVLLCDREAEHIPGCNMAFRKDRLQGVGGFDPQFCVAGDDADLCWRMRERGWTLGFAPAAMVWHHPRCSVRAYWKQQKGYGRADAMLARKWPEKYNAVGNLRWEGRLYGRGLPRRIGWRRERIYHGTWGAALFQSVYQPAPGMLETLPLTPEWHLFGGVLLALAALSMDWIPMVLTLPLFVFVVAASCVQAFAGAADTSNSATVRPQVTRLKLLGVTAFLHLLQPLARLRGRFACHRTPQPKLSMANLSLPRPRNFALWSERWRAPKEWLASVEATLRASGAAPIRGGDYDRWDLELRGGRLGAARLHMAVEEHGGGKQLVRFRAWPRYSSEGIGTLLLLSALSIWAAFDHAWLAAALLGAVAGMLVFRVLWEGAVTMTTILQALEEEEPPGDSMVLSDTANPTETRAAS